MSDELAHLEKDLLGQLRKMQDYLAALEAQNSELILQNNSLEAQNLTLRTAQNNLTEQQILDRYGERTMDRLAHLCRTIHFEGESLRK